MLVVAGLEVLQREGVFLTSLAELRRTGVLKHYDYFAYWDKWLVLDHILASCVLADGTVEQFIKHVVGCREFYVIECFIAIFFRGSIETETLCRFTNAIANTFSNYPKYRIKHPRPRL